MTKKALVTGASEGIGRSFAERLAKDGYQVTVVARTESKLKDVVQALGAGHRYVVADLSSETGWRTVGKELEATHYDLLVNNAGVGTVGTFTDVPLDKQLAMLHLNCEALVALSHIYLKGAKSGDALINVSSTLAFLPMPSIGLYCATKAFVTSLSESLWFENKARGVYVMGLCPGITTTNFQTNAGGRKEDIPNGMSQTPEQVVDVAICHLESRAKPTVISGGQNKVGAFITRILPRKSVVSMMGKMGGQNPQKSLN